MWLWLWLWLWWHNIIVFIIYCLCRIIIVFLLLYYSSNLLLNIIVCFESCGQQKKILLDTICLSKKYRMRVFLHFDFYYYNGMAILSYLKNRTILVPHHHHHHHLHLLSSMIREITFWYCCSCNKKFWLDCITNKAAISIWFFSFINNFYRQSSILIFAVVLPLSFFPLVFSYPPLLLLLLPLFLFVVIVLMLITSVAVAFTFSD